MEFTTRNQLKGYGLSSYQAIAVTKSLSPIAKEKCLNCYALGAVITEIKKRLNNRRINPQNCLVLEKTLKELLLRFNSNVVYLPFSLKSEPILEKSSREAFTAFNSLNDYEREIKSVIATLQGKRHE
ncbi:hypothetical protein B1L04_26565 [Microcystis aeruginosa KW]|uniref:Uncharacterized protein n=1 Tax=Microcystis aeruginosa KW TaxID=1960155 RepID=A0A1V4BPY6_MICAE|nr:hypothetical protein [Microcystis aeruginosa]OPF15953.1 hypothetical protein B1L04_26565 [Microcystis aeruginosa KW]